MEATSKRGQWQEILETQKRSGISIAAFCRKEDLHQWQFYYWRKRLEVPDDGFVELVRPHPTGRRAGLSIRRGDLEIMVECDFDGPTLRKLLQTIEC